MKKKYNAWIHTRVSSQEQTDLLEYQKSLLCNLLDQPDIVIIGVSEEISKGTNPYSYALRKMYTHIRHHQIDFIIVYDDTRILIYKDMLDEFKMFCDMYDVIIVSYQEIKEAFPHITKL